MMPTAMLPMIPARMILADTHSARERMKKNEMITRISTTVLSVYMLHQIMDVGVCILLGSS